MKKQSKIPTIISALLLAMCYNQQVNADFFIKDVIGLCTSANITDINQLASGDHISTNSYIACAANSHAWIRSDDGTNIRLPPDSVVRLINYKNDKESENGTATLEIIKGGLNILHTLANNYDVFYKLITTAGSIDYYGGSLKLRICNSDCDAIYPVPSNAVYMISDSDDTVFRNFSGGLTLDANAYTAITNAKSLPIPTNQAMHVINHSPFLDFTDNH